MGKNLISFETNDEIVHYSSEHGFDDVKFPFAHGKENIYFMVHQNYIPLQEYENSAVNNEYQYLYKKDDVLKGIIITVQNGALLNMVTIF